MTIIEQAQLQCDKLGITDQNDRELYIEGYLHGSHDQLKKEIERDKENLNYLLGLIPKKSIPDAETR